jgi:hypothetical protein
VVLSPRIPVSVAGSSSSPEITGAYVTINMAESGLLLPPYMGVETVLMEFGPGSKDEGKAYVNVPSLNVSVVVLCRTPFTQTEMVWEGSEKPFRTGRMTLVIPSVGLIPESVEARRWRFAGGYST